ncbi:MAG: radical SAM family heme chaperone HemW [Candidatus Binatia bacterium]|nr:radical SAM family heme chaperone HemW [Candidatus Binatia bacterium]
MSFSLYIHIPYCLVKCPYCDFNAYAVRTWPEERYIEALCAELRHYVSRPPWDGQAVATVYFGGGTPSLFSPVSLQRFLDCVAKLCPFVTEDIEMTIEADPATLTRDKLAAYRALGINRLSLGLQSFQPHLLQTLGRLHKAEDGTRALEWAREVGFTNVNADLIFAVPGQTLALLEEDLQQLFALAPEHLSLYNLTYEEHTPFWTMRNRGQLQPVDEETEAEMYLLIQERCRAQGYRHYEISNFARPGFWSRHNTTYWQGGSYLGLGAGAHSYVSEPPWGMRWSNIKNPKTYMAKALTQGEANSTVEVLTRAQAMGEFAFLQLRQLEGFPLSQFADRFGVSFMDAFPHVTELIASGLLQEAAGRIQLTPRGLLLADTIFASFF